MINNNLCIFKPEEYKYESNLTCCLKEDESGHVVEQQTCFCMFSEEDKFMHVFRNSIILLCCLRKTRFGNVSVGKHHLLHVF